MKDHHIYCHLKNKVLILLFILFLFYTQGSVVFASEENKIIKARQLFYQSVQKSDTIDKAITGFIEIGKNQEYEGLALTYIGALTALKGKFASFPYTKYKHVKKGLKLMDIGMLKSPENIEARFIRGTTCYYLPFFFKRKKTAENDFKNIVKQLNTDYLHYDKQIILNVTAFLLENAKLNIEEKEIVKNVQNIISKDAD